MPKTSSKKLLKKPRKQIPEGFSFVREIDGIAEYLFDKNGLRVLVKEDHSFPTALLMLTYLVGSRHEKSGYTGAAHLLEHMMFKGSDRFNRANGKQIDVYLGNIGANLNASTAFDRTNYYEILPVRHLPEVIAIEADRMRHAHVTTEDFASEMPVVRNEFEMHENLPEEGMERNLFATAFQAHPYRNPVIGWYSDIENMPIEELKRFYNHYYWPDNCYLTVMGAVETIAVLELIKKEFGAIPRGPALPQESITPEPPQEGERRFAISREGSKSMLFVGYKTPAGQHPEMPALMAFFDILCGGRSSLLHKALINKGLASDIGAFCYPLRDPAIAWISATPAKGVPAEKIERVVLREIEHAKNSITAAELSRAKAKLIADYQFEKDGLASIAHNLSEAIAMGDWTWYPHFPEMIEKLTLAEVKAVARKYFIERHRTMGRFIGTRTPETVTEKR